MIIQDIEIEYTDGTIETVHSDQRDVAEFQMWAFRRGMFPPAGQQLSDVMPTLVSRVVAWSAHQRALGKAVEWSDWDKRVIQVVRQELRETDPTRQAALAEPSDSSPPEQE